MLGSSEEEVGFDTGQNPAVMQTIAERAVLSFPWIAELQIVRAWAALRVMPPDGLPIYDQSERFPGAFTANCHSGVTLGRGARQSVRADGRRPARSTRCWRRSRPGASMFRLRPDAAAPRRSTVEVEGRTVLVPQGASAAAAVLLAGLSAIRDTPVAGAASARPIA